MKADFISTVTRRRDCLTFAMKKRPTSGLVTYIRTQHGNADVTTSHFKDLTVFVVLNAWFVYCPSPLFGIILKNLVYRIMELINIDKSVLLFFKMNEKNNYINCLFFLFDFFKIERPIQTCFRI